MDYDRCTEDDVEAALRFIDADCPRDAWAQIGMAIKSEFGDGGFSLFDDWSSGVSSYNEAACKSTWKSIKSVGAGSSITIATLFQEAIRGGYQPEKKELTDAEKQQREAAANQRRQQREREALEEKERSKRWVQVYAEFFETFQQHYLSGVGQSKYLVSKRVYPFGIGYIERNVIVLTDLEDQSVQAISGSQAISDFFDNPDYKDKDRYSFLYLKPGTIAVPMLNRHGQLCSYQIIFASGTKTFFKSARKKGLFHRINGEDEEIEVTTMDSPAPSFISGSPIAIAEGYATAASIRMATKWPCYVAFDAGNLLHVAKVVRQRYPKAVIMICGDDDSAKQDTGKIQGEKAAQAVGGHVVIPQFVEISE